MIKIENGVLRSPKPTAGDFKFGASHAGSAFAPYGDAAGACPTPSGSGNPCKETLVRLSIAEMDAPGMACSDVNPHACLQSRALETLWKN